MGQMWLQSKNNYLSGLLFGSKKRSDSLFVLFAGFMQDKCDSYYFMKDFAYFLSENNFNVLLIDISGSGDSFGDIENITLDSIKDDMRSISEYSISHGYKQCYAIARGLLGNVLADISCSEKLFNKITCFNPVYVSTELKNDINHCLLNNRESGLIEISSEVYEDLAPLFKMTGTERSNIEGEIINAGLLKEIISESFYDFSVINEEVEVFYTQDMSDFYEKTNISIYNSDDIKMSDYNQRSVLMKKIVEKIENVK